jgi:hypothetical protein
MLHPGFVGLNRIVEPRYSVDPDLGLPREVFNVDAIF